MKLIRSQGRVVIKDNPGCIWLLGLFMGTEGCFAIYGALGGFSNRNEVSAFALIITFVIGAAIIAASVWVITSKAISTIIIDRNTETVTHTSIGVKGKKTRTYLFSDIRRFYLIQDTDSEGDPIWSLAMQLITGETIDLSAMESHDEKYKQDFVFEANTFIYKEMPSYDAKDILPDENNPGIS